MLGVNLGLLLYGEVSVMRNVFFFFFFFFNLYIFATKVTFLKTVDISFAV